MSSSSGALTIAQAGTATTFALSNSNTTFTANVAAITTGTPTGTVAFLAGQTTLGTANLVNGTATLTGVTIPAGNITLSAQYSGDVDFTQSAAPPILLLAITPANTTLTASTAGTVTDMLTLAAIPGYTGSVQLSCAQLPPNTSCSFSPQSVAFGSTATANVTVMIATGTGTTAALANSNSPLLAAVFGGPALFSLLYLRRRCNMPLRSLILPAFLLLSSTLLLSSCGGGSVTTSAPSTGTNTPTGTYAISVMAAGSNNLTQSTPLTLTVH